MAAEAGEDELPGFGVPVEVDGHAHAGAEPAPQGDMQREDPGDAFVGRGVIGGVAYPGMLTQSASEVAEADLPGQEFVRLKRVGWIGLQLSEINQSCQVTVQCALVFEHAAGSFVQSLFEDGDIFGELGLQHVLGQHFVGRAMGLSRLRRR